MDGIRGVLTLLVVLGHVRLELITGWSESPGASFLAQAFYVVSGFQEAAVLSFFVLSGFLITYKYAAPLYRGEMSLWSFAQRRALRLYVVLIPTLLFSALLVRLESVPAQAQLSTWRGAALTLLFLQPEHAALFAGNRPLWSLGYEGVCYLAFGSFLATFGLGRGIAARCLGVLALAAVLFSFEYLTLYGLSWLFGAGAALFFRRSQQVQHGSAAHRRQWAFFWLSLLLAAVGALALRWGHFYESPLPDWASMLTVGAFVASALVYSDAGLAPASPLGGLVRLFARLAPFSYSTYLIHYPLLIGLSAYWGIEQQAPSAPVMLHVLGMTTLLFFLSWLWFKAFESRTAWLKTRLKIA